MNGQAVLAWIKANVIIVVCCVVILGALVAGPIVSGGFNEEVKSKVSKQLKEIKNIDRAGRTKFSWPEASGGSNTLITQKHVDEYNKVAAEIAAQSDALTGVAIEANRGDQAVLMPELFPEPASQNRDRDLQVLPPELYRRISNGYDQVLLTLSAGEPLPTKEVVDLLDAKRVDYLDRNLRLGADEQLNPEQQKDLTEFLTSERLSMYVDHASGIGIYLSKETLAPPAYQLTDSPKLDEMFQWQWRLWVIERIADVIKDVNAANNEILAPVHAIDQLNVRGLMETTTPRAGDRAFLAASGAAKGDGGGGRGGRGGRGEQGSVPGAGELDPNVSVTGHITNDMHDIVLVDIDMVVSLDRVDDVLDAFDRPGVMTIVDLAMQRLNVFDRLKEGYYFGDTPVIRLVVTVETLWLRAWTGDAMPDDVRTTLGLPERESSEPQEEDRSRG